MIKAIAIMTSGTKTEILHAGLKGDCLKVARDAGMKLKKLGEAEIHVFANPIFSDDGRKADYQARLADDQAKAAKAAELRAKEAKAKRIAALEAELDEARGPKPAAKKVATKSAKGSTD